MECSDSSLAGTCRSGCCQNAEAEAPELVRLELDQETTATYSDEEAGGDCVQSLDREENASGELDTTINRGGRDGLSATRAMTEGCASNCCSGPILTTAKGESPSAHHGDADVDADCCGNTYSVDKDNTNCMENTSTFPNRVDRCGVDRHSEFVDPEAEAIRETSSVVRVKGAERIQKTLSCSSEIMPLPSTACKSECCEDVSGEQAAKQVSAVPSNGEDLDCCAGKEAPCCNESCIDRITARECEKNSNCKETRSKTSLDTPSAEVANGCCPNGIMTRQFYREILKSLGCLCVTLKTRGEPSCCVPPPRSTLDSARTVDVNRSAKQYMHKQGSQTSVRASATNCDLDDTPCGSPCCETETAGSKGAAVQEKESSAPHLESGLPRSTLVVLSVSGMTCTGCESKLQRSLAAFKAIQNLKTSLVLCRAEFDLDLRSESVHGVIRRLERITEFKFEEIKQEGSEIEVCPLNVQAFIQQELPEGVVSIKAVDKSTARIWFDPHVVGARNLVERSFGTPLKLAPIQPDPSLAAGSKHVRHVGLVTLLSAVLTIPVLVLAWAPIPERTILYGSISLALATLVQLVVAGPFYPTALKSLVFSRMIEMDLLIVISTSAAYIFSVVSFGYTVTGDPLPTREFFETSTLLVTLIMVGRFVSALARQKAVESVSVRSLQVPTAFVTSERSTLQKEIDARLLQYDDLFRVAPESRVPTDGTVVSGTSDVDESMITGESVPVGKQPGSAVIGGSINGAGVLTVRLTRLPGSNTISTIASMVDEAKLSKPKVQEAADRVASFFVPTAIALSIAVFVIWIPIGIKVRGYTASQAVIEALTYGITVIILSCPCAIGLAVPMVVMIAGGVAAKHGCIFKTATTIEVARKTSHVVFDKTGTLTQGKMTVAATKYFENEQNDEVFIAGAVLSLLSNIKHPVAAAVRMHLESQTTPVAAVLNVNTLAGKGVTGNVNDKNVKAGNSGWLGLDSHPEIQNHHSQGHTTFCVTINDGLAAIFGLEDVLRPDAASTVSSLQQRGISVSIVSGDDEGPVSALARQLGITSYKARCTPRDKQQFMKELNPLGKSTTIFCGDGTNDAVALAEATVGVHVNEGTDVARSAADVVLVRSSLRDILTLIDLSSAAMWRVAFNFGWAVLYNVAALLLASGALVRTRIPPQYAGLGELFSVLPVIAIALQLRWARFQKTEAGTES